MSRSTASFIIEVKGIQGTCPAGEKYGDANIASGKIPVFSCEGSCIKGEIARLAANMIGEEEPYKRACHGEVMAVPYSAQSQWAKTADKAVVVDGCFLQCHNRMLSELLGEDCIINFDAYSICKQFGELYDIDEAPEQERIKTAKIVANEVLKSLKCGANKSAQTCC